MIHKVTVGLQQKIGQPNFGSIGASCTIEIQLDDDEACHPGVIANRVTQSFAQCRASIEKELSLHEAEHPSGAPRVVHGPAEPRLAPDRRSATDRAPRAATEAQVRAIRAIASKAGVSLASELEQGFGVHNPNQLTMAQASQMIDSLKQGLTPSPA